MSVQRDQRDWLNQTIEWAKQIEAELAEVRKSRLGEVHFRPTSKGVTLISLHPDRPQLGMGFKGVKNLKKKFEAKFQTHCVHRTPKRRTPEKRLQSFLIANAYRNARQLINLEGNSGGAELFFVTDELSLPFDGKKIVCDIIVLQRDQPVVIELKTQRQKKQLVKQVIDYATLVEEHQEQFCQLFSVILKRKIVLRRPCQRWIVWPQLPGYDRDPQEESLAQLNIRVVGYAEIGRGYEFQVGKRIKG